ncbi:hypothetical protein IB211_01883 [Intestinimonas butyriciproducens]|uniref:Uncharacterized protein n=1 Tax=Intestinimonas butyriciproducens TaxID=1297617 RepID=A0A0S2W4V3_9FIRM|nr:hypothetical protein IB211_01883 [Intestinimonas butyriciproducens]
MAGKCGGVMFNPAAPSFSLFIKFSKKPEIAALTGIRQYTA